MVSKGEHKKKDTLKRLQSFEIDVYRRLLKVSWRDRLSNNAVFMQMNKELEIIKAIKKRKLQYFDHIM